MIYSSTNGLNRPSEATDQSAGNQVAGIRRLLLQCRAQQSTARTRATFYRPSGEVGIRKAKALNFARAHLVRRFPRLFRRALTRRKT
jgi:hypothetical protein